MSKYLLNFLKALGGAIMKNSQKLHLLTEMVRENEYYKRNPDIENRFSEDLQDNLDQFKDAMLKEMLPIMGQKLKEAGEAWKT